MINISRRQLARYGADQLLAGTPAKKVFRQLAAVLISSRRSDETGLLVDDVAYELEARGKFATARVTTAHPIGPGLRTQIKQAVKKAAKVETVDIEEITNKSVLGGVDVETAIHSWDETIARRLNDLKGIA